MAQLEAEQQAASDGLFDTFEHLQADFYKPAAIAAIVSLGDQARNSAEVALTAMLLVILVGLVLSMAGCWQACGCSARRWRPEPCRTRRRPRTRSTPSSSMPWT